jgi:DNA-binding transcriptional regulator YhcF (GntR family)
MTELDIREKFEINRNNGKGLAKQLKNKLAEFIRANPAGTKLPPERKLAEELNVSRVTVRGALDYFFERGEIVRKGSRGTFTAKVGAQFFDIHPMLMEVGMHVKSKANLNFVSFETYPQQRVFWNKAINMFNAGYSHASVALKELPENILSSNYAKYVLENGHDILMLQSGYEDIDDLLAPVPEFIIKKLNSDDYAFEGSRIKFKNSVPIKSSTTLICWNKEIAAKLGIKNISERLKKGEILELHREAAEKMTDGFCAGGHLWDYFSLRGMNSKITMNFLEQRLKQFEKFSGIPKMFICEQEYGFEVVDRFKNGELLFAPALSNFYCDKNIPFDLGGMFFIPDKGNILSRDTINLGVYKNSPNKKAAFDFIDFMLSESAQNLSVTETWSSPCLKKSAKLFSQILDGVDDECISKYFERTPFAYDGCNLSYSKQHCFMVLKIRDVLYGLMHGKLKSKQAAEIILKRWNKYSKK